MPDRDRKLRFRPGVVFRMLFEQGFLPGLQQDDRPMSLMSELRIRARHVLLPPFGVAAVFYFAYHGVNGDRGLLAWRAMQQQVADTRVDLASVRGEREILERRVKLLYPGSLDPDMLDESSRRLLNYGLPEERVILNDTAEDR